MEREHPACGSCGGCQKNKADCGGCTGCGQGSAELLLCREEIILLEELAQFAFLPLVVTREDGRLRCAPVDNALPIDPAHFSGAVESLLWKKLIVLDETLPIEHLDYGEAGQVSGAACGSIALTLQGQEAITLIALAP